MMKKYKMNYTAYGMLKDGLARGYKWVSIDIDGQLHLWVDEPYRDNAYIWMRNNVTEDLPMFMLHAHIDGIYCNDLKATWLIDLLIHAIPVEGYKFERGEEDEEQF